MHQKKRLTSHFTGEWELLPIVNEHEAPLPRCGHTLTIHGKYGQYDTNGNNNKNVPYTKLLTTFGESSLLLKRDYYSDMHIFDVDSSKWVQILGNGVKTEYRRYIKSNFNPIARADHSACAFGRNNDRCILFGGKCQDTYLDDLICIKNISNFPISKVEKEISAQYNDVNLNLFNPPQYFTSHPLRIDAIHLSKTPSSRRGASLCNWKEGAFLLFGGQRGGVFFNDLWGLDLYKQGWVELTTRRNPMPRAFHSAFVDSQQQMLLLGGVRDTMANPAPSDIFKLDLRAGKFSRLGDKDVVPGLSSALSKGHHESHFLKQTSNLIIYAPQSANCHVLGGNLKDEHCGRCTTIRPTTYQSSQRTHSLSSSSTSKSPSPSLSDNTDQSKQCQPPGTCRPSTVLVPSDCTPLSLKSYGCNKQILERIIVFGGYNSHSKTCVSDIYSMKFSNEPCAKKDHKCYLTTTPLLENPNIIQMKEIELKRFILQEKEKEQEQEQDQTDENNKRLSNVTPMRTNTSKSLLLISNNSNSNSNSNSNPSSSSQRVGNNNNSKSSKSKLCSSLLSSGSSSSASASTSALFQQKKKVSIAQTPVRIKANSSNINLAQSSFVCFENESVTQQRIMNSGGLDPTLVDAHQRYDNNNNNQEQEHNNSLHWQFIEKLLLNFDESLLDQNSAFLFEPSEVIQLIYEALPLLELEATLVRIDGPCKVFGDIHGQLGDLMNLFRSFGYPDTNVGDIGYYKYVFLGDYVDRGQKSLEIICLLLALKIEYPDRVLLVRGNHECHSMNELYGFYHEIQDRLFPNIMTLKHLDNGTINEQCKYYNNKHSFSAQAELDKYLTKEQQQNTELYSFDINYLEYDDLNGQRKYKPRHYFNCRHDCINYLTQSFELLFQWLPLSVLIEDRILCVHGGIGRIQTINEIESIARPCDVVCDVQVEMNSTEKRIVDLLWSDPAECDNDIGFQENKRGVSCVFGSDVVRTFCKTNNIDLIIRGHQVVKDGYEYFANGHLITLFSATNYCNIMDNAGAILCIDDKLRVLPKLCEPRSLKQRNSNNNDDDDDEEEEEEEDDQEEEEEDQSQIAISFDDEEEEEEEEEDQDDNTPTSQIQSTQEQKQWKEFDQFPPSPMRNADKFSNENNLNDIKRMNDNLKNNINIQPQNLSFESEDQNV